MTAISPADPDNSVPAGLRPKRGNKLRRRPKQKPTAGKPPAPKPRKTKQTKKKITPP